MMSERLTQLLRSLRLSRPAAASTIVRLTKAVGFSLPEDYLEFLRVSNGATPRKLAALQQIYSATEALTIWRNNEYDFAEAGLLEFATDGGGHGFCFYLHGDRTVIVQVSMEHVGDPTDWAFLGESLEQFLELMARWDVAIEADEELPPPPRLPSAPPPPATSDLAVAPPGLWRLLPTPHPENVEAAACSADGTRMVTIGTDGMRLWEFPAWRELLFVPLAPPPGLYFAPTVALSHDGAYVLVGQSPQGYDGPEHYVQIYESATGHPLGRVGPFAGYPDGIQLRPGSNEFLVTTRKGCALPCFEIPTGRPVPRLATFEREVVSAEFSDDGQILAVKLRDSKAVDKNGNYQLSYEPEPVRLFNGGTGQLLREIPDKRFLSHFYALSPDATLLAVGGRGKSNDGQVGVMDAQTGSLLWSSNKKNNQAWRILFTTDGRLVIVLSYAKSLDVWDTAKGKRLATWKIKSKDMDYIVVRSGDPRLAISTGRKGGQVALWRLPEPATKASGGPRRPKH